jgi:hypothetical protein
MVYFPLVFPTLVSDIKRLEAEFTHGYKIGESFFNVSLTNEKGRRGLLLFMIKTNGSHFEMRKMRSLKHFSVTLQVLFFI